MAKNIEMNHLSPDGSYEALYPKTMASITYPSSSILSLLGLSENSNVDDAFNVLSRFQNGLGNEYVWEKKKTTNVQKYDQVTENNVKVFYTSNYYSYADSYEIIENKFYLVNATQIVPTNTTDCTQFEGKYVAPGKAGVGSNTLYFIPEGNSFSFDTSGYPDAWIASTRIIMSNLRTEEIIDFFGYINSPNPNAYPPAVSDGYTYTALGQLGAKAQIATGTYTGTGTYGSSNPNSLTFDFAPKIVFLYGVGQHDYTPVVIYSDFEFNKNYTYFGSSTSASCSLYFTSLGTTISWFSNAGNDSQQLNGNTLTYYYCAIG